MRDQKFLSGAFFDIQICKERRYLKKYFKTPILQAFLKYYLFFGDYESFVNHTGYRTCESYLRKCFQRVHGLMEAHRQAKLNCDAEMLFKIESGKFKKWKDYYMSISTVPLFVKSPVELLDSELESWNNRLG